MDEQMSLWVRVLVGIVLATLLACGLTPQKNTPQYYVWPLPPDLPRYVYEFTLDSTRNLHTPPAKSILHQFATAQEKEAAVFEHAYYKPYAIAARHGRIYVTDSAAGLIHAYDVAARRFFRFGYRLEGKLDKPLDVALDRQMQVYVVDAKTKRIVVYDADGLFIRAFAQPQDFVYPTGIGVSADGQRIYVVDRGDLASERHQVVMFNAQGEKVGTLGKRGLGAGEFNLPVDIAVSAGGNVYVLDAGNFRVQVFDAQGKFLHKWGTPGAQGGQFARPRAIAVDDAERVYVSDGAFGHVQIFNAQGQLLLVIGHDYPGANVPGGFPLVAGLAVDETWRLYVVDQYYRKVEIFRSLDERESQQLQKILLNIK